MIHSIIGKFLHDSDAIRNRVSGPDGARIWPEHAPQVTKKKTGEHIVISDLGGDTLNTLENESEAANSVVQVACYSDSTTKAWSLWQLVRNRLSGYYGDVTYLEDGEEATTWISATVIRKAMDVTDPDDSSDTWKYGYSADFNVFYHQTVPDHT